MSTSSPWEPSLPLTNKSPVPSLIIGKQWLKRYVFWTHIDAGIEVVEHFRHVGAHMNVTGRNNAARLTKRFNNGIAMLSRVATLPVSRAHKAMVIRAKILAATLYGSEVAQPTEKDVAAFAAATTHAIANNTSHHAVDLIFASCSTGSDLDVTTNMRARKCTMLRRAIAKGPHEINIYKEMINLHIANGTCGATHDSDTDAQRNCTLEALIPAPHPTRASRAEWKPGAAPPDPIAYLLAKLVNLGARLNRQLQIRIFNEPPIDIVATPYQYLYSSVLEAGARARTRAAEGTKTVNMGLYEIDKAATTASHHKLEEEEIMFLQTLQAGGGWTKTQLMDIRAVDSCECDLCGKLYEGMDYIWDCQHPDLIHVRQSADEDIAEIGNMSFPLF